MIIFEWITLKGRVQSSAKTVSGDNRGRVTLFSKGTTKTGNAKLGVSLREGGKEAWPRKGEREATGMERTCEAASTRVRS